MALGVPPFVLALQPLSLYVEMEQLGVENGDSLQFQQGENGTVVMNGDSQATIADENNVVDNGIVHVLDSVLVPSSLFFSPTPGRWTDGWRSRRERVVVMGLMGGWSIYVCLCRAGTSTGAARH